MRCLIVLLLGIGLAMPATTSADWDKTNDALERGDYAAVLEYLRPLLEDFYFFTPFVQLVLWPTSGSLFIHSNLAYLGGAPD